VGEQKKNKNRSSGQRRKDVEVPNIKRRNVERITISPRKRHEDHKGLEKTANEMGKEMDTKEKKGS